jgi:leader peptidase (prepilin peptidase)/N-methyltransferase
MLVVEFLQTHMLYSGIIVFVFALIMGSFFNVVILRYPEMLKRAFLKECIDCSDNARKPLQDSSKTNVFNLMYPPSHCPHCKKKLKWFHNIPVFSYLFLKGRCAFCRTSISYIYPIIEILTAVLAVSVFFYFGFQIKMIAGIIFVWFLILITFIDIREFLIPDILSLSLLWLGLFFNLWHVFTPLDQAVIGAIAGYLILFIIAKVFYWIRRKEGMGEGDFKLLAALGAWFGWTTLPIVLFVAVLLSLVVSAVIMCARQRFSLSMVVPFAPFLSISGIFLLFWH